MRFGSLFSGIGGIDLGLERAGIKCAWQVEIDPYRRAVLARHWPDVRRYEDVRGVCGDRSKQMAANPAIHRFPRKPSESESLDPVDLICGGFPCQDVSTAGRRAGLRAERSGLFFEFARIVGELRPRWILVENVPGLYSSNAGKDFDTVIGTLAELRYGLAWRVLDSQYFGVPQRRRRVFIVGYLGGPCPSAVLFEREGGERHPEAGGKAGESIAHGLRASPRGVDEHTGTTYIPETGYALPASGRGSGDQHGNWWNTTYVAEENTRDEMRIRGSHPHVSARWGGKQKPWVIKGAAIGRKPEAGPQRGEILGDGTCFTLNTAEQHAICAPPDADRVRETPSLPRRLDSRRYAALGDAVTVNVAEWIGKRIMAVERCIS